MTSTSAAINPELPFILPFNAFQEVFDEAEWQLLGGELKKQGLAFIELHLKRVALVGDWHCLELPSAFLPRP